MEGPEAPDTFCNCSHEATMRGWEGQEQTDVCPGLSLALVCNPTPTPTQQLRSISGSPILEAACEVTTICAVLLTC